MSKTLTQRFSRLTDLEFEVVKLLAANKLRAEIIVILDTSWNCLDDLLRSIKRKLMVDSLAKPSSCEIAEIRQSYSEYATANQSIS